MRVLVTGGTGFIGQHLVAQLVEHGANVTVMAREKYALGGALPVSLAANRSHVDIVFADLRNYNLTSKAVLGAAPDFVFHLAAAGVSDPFLPQETALRHNLHGTLNLIRACFQVSGPRTSPRLLVARTPGERTAMNMYAASKAAAWAFCQMYARTEGWPISGVMIYQAYGPGQSEGALIPSAMRSALAQQSFPLTSGCQERDWIYVDDVVAGFTAAIDKPLRPGLTVDLGTGRLTAVKEVVNCVFELVGGDGQPLIGALPDRPGEAPSQVADASRTRTLLDWEAKITLSEGLHRLLRTFTNQPTNQ